MNPTMTETPRRIARVHKPPIVLMAIGALAAIAGFVTMNTKLVLAYRGGTLANVHALCSSPFLAAKCSSINADYTLASVAMWGGLILASIGLLVFLTQRRAA